MPAPEQLLTVPEFPRAREYAGIWAIEEMAGQTLWSLAQRADLTRHVEAATPAKLESADYQSLKVGNGQHVAIIPIAGTMMKAVGSLQNGTSTVLARRALRKAANDPEVSGIILAIDSPGGTVSGTGDLATEVRDAQKSKPLWAFIEDLGASAAYWVASQAERVIANTQTAMVGSIGTLAIVYDLSGAAEQAGVKALVFGTGPLKGAGAPGSVVTEEQQDYFRNLVEDAQKSFDAAVRKGRSFDVKQLDAVRSGGVFGASEALRLGLIDGIQSFDRTVNELAAESRKRSKAAMTRATSPQPSERRTAVDENDTTTQATVAPVATLADPIAEMRQQAAAETERIAGVQRVCAGNTTLATQAIREGWTVDRAELHALRASLASNVQAGNPHGGPHLNFGHGRFTLGSAEAAPGVSTALAVECAIRINLGRDVERDYRPEVCQAARESFRNISLQQVLMMAAVQNGYSGSPFERIHAGNLREVLRAAFNPTASSAGTATVSGILSNVANKELLAGYMEEDNSWEAISAIKSVSDFKQVTSYRMLDDMEYEEVGPDGKIKSGTLNEESYTRQAKTYAKMFALTRAQIINDDLGAFDDVRTRLGRGSAKKMRKVFWTTYMTDLVTFFTAARGNYISGAGTVLDNAGVGLSAGVLQFRKMGSPSTDGNKKVNANTQNPVGSNPGGRPEILLVPPELEANAEILHRNQNLGQVGGSTANIHANKYRPVVAWQLSDSSYPNFSLTHWFLFNTPSYLAPMVVSFLNGNRSPVVETADADFDTLGVQMRGYHDFGCDKAEYLAGVHSKGAA